MVKEMNLVFFLISLSRCKKFEKMSSRYCFLFSSSFLNKYIFKLPNQMATTRAVQDIVFSFLLHIHHIGRGRCLQSICNPPIGPFMDSRISHQNVIFGLYVCIIDFCLVVFKGLVRFHIQNRKPSLSRKHHFKDSNCIITWLFFFSKF